MALTKNDLNQIRTVVREEVDERLEARLDPIEKDLGSIRNRLAPVEEKLGKIENRLSPIEKDIKDIKKRVRKIEKTVDVIGRNYDEGDVILDRRVTKIEEHLNLGSKN